MEQTDRQIYYNGEVRTFLLKLKKNLYNEEIYEYIKKRVEKAASKMTFDKTSLFDSYSISSSCVFLRLSESDSLHVEIVKYYGETLKVLFREIKGQNIETLEVLETGKRTLFKEYKRYGISTYSTWSLYERKMNFVFSKKREKYLYFDREEEHKSYLLGIQNSESFVEDYSERSKSIFTLKSAKEYLTENYFSDTYENSEHYFGRCAYYDPLQMDGDDLDMKIEFPPEWFPYGEKKGKDKMEELKQKMLLPKNMILK